MKDKQIEEIKKERRRQTAKAEMLNREWYSLRHILGYSWALIYVLLGAREAGKSYSVTEFFVRQYKKYKRPFFWLRLTDESASKLLNNNAEKLVDPDIRRKYKLDLETSAGIVYNVTERDSKGKAVKKEIMARVFALSTFYNDKGSGIFDKDFLNDPKMYYNICLDEMNREKNERKTFDIVYAFVNQLENLIRSTKNRLRVFCIGNTLEEASDLLAQLNFIPETFGIFSLKKKRTVIEYIAPSKKYLERRKGTISDILTPNASTFTNQIDVDKTLINKGRLKTPTEVIVFSRDKEDWFTVWDGSTIKKYNGEKVKQTAMRPYLDKLFNTEMRDIIISLFDNRNYKFRDLITQKLFKKQLELLKPRK